MHKSKPQRPYEIQESNPNWEKVFYEIADELKYLFGDVAIKIVHIGSTSIKNMAAKPQIDVLVAVKDLSVIPTYYQKLKEAGFTPQGRGYTHSDDEYVTKDDEKGTRHAGIHILQEGNPQIDLFLTFRDYLNSNESDRMLYTETKKMLYKKYPNDYLSYGLGKKKVVTDIIKRAQEWSHNKNP